MHTPYIPLVTGQEMPTGMTETTGVEVTTTGVEVSNTATISRETTMKTVTMTMGKTLATSVENNSSISSSVIIEQGKDNNPSSIFLIAILISFGCIILLLVVVTIILGAVVYWQKRTTRKLKINNKSKTDDVKMDTIVEYESVPPIYTTPFPESLQQQVCNNCV